MYKKKFLIFIIALASFHLYAKDPAIVIIDMQESYLSEYYPTPEFKQLVKEQQKVIRWARTKGVPIIVVEYSGLGNTVQLIKGSLGKENTFYIQKFSPGAFDEGTTSKREISNILKNYRINELIIMGINADYCVAASIKGALILGMKVISIQSTMGNFLPFSEPEYPNSHLDSFYFMNGEFNKTGNTDYKSVEELIF